MMLRKTTIALGTAIAALGTSAFDGAAAGYFFGGGYRGYIEGFGYVNRAPQPNQSLPGATSRREVPHDGDPAPGLSDYLAAPRPTNRDMRMSPSMGGRSLRGGGRGNGGMGRR
jgi:hypothetical protein